METRYLITASLLLQFVLKSGWVHYRNIPFELTSFDKQRYTQFLMVVIIWLLNTAGTIIILGQNEKKKQQFLVRKLPSKYLS